MPATNNKGDKNHTPAIIGAIGLVLAAIISGYFSYYAGINTIQLPISYTQTASAKQTPAAPTLVTQPPVVVTQVVTQIVTANPTIDDKVLLLDAIQFIAIPSVEEEQPIRTWLEVVHNDSGVSYRLIYKFLQNTSSRAALRFYFDKPLDLSTYDSMELTLIVEERTGMKDLTVYLPDTLGNGTGVQLEPDFSTESINVTKVENKNQEKEILKTFTIPLRDNFKDVNWLSVRAIFFDVYSENSQQGGEIRYRVTNIKFIRR